MIAYFANLGRPKLILWAYLVWYLTLSALHFDPSPTLWLSSLGISLLIGSALVLSTRQPGQSLPFWVTARLYLFPFCVSSYSALIKDKGFILIFPRNPAILGIGLAACAAFIGFHWLCRRLRPTGISRR